MKKYWILIILFFAGLIVSALNPHDYFTWFLEVMPGIIGLVLLVLTFKRFEFTYLVYILIFVHCYILFIGGHYTYAEVPLFDWVRDTFGQDRNNYDKLGHFAQGFVPAIIIREILIRNKVLQKGFWLSFLTLCVCGTFSVFYEFFEWAIAILSGESAESFLGTQGYVWDTHADILFAVIGATTMLILLSKVHDKQIASK